METSRTLKSFKNVKAAMAVRMVSVILAFVSRKIIIDTIGIEYLGLNGLFSEILAVLSMADMGIETGMIYSFYKPFAQNDCQRIKQLVYLYRGIYRKIICIISIMGIAVVPFLKHIVQLNNEIKYLEIYYIIYLLNTIVSYFYGYKIILFHASQNGYIVSNYKLVFDIVKMVLQVLSLLLFENYILFLNINVIVTLGSNWVLNLKINKLYPYVNEKGCCYLEYNKDLTKNIKASFIYKLAGVFVGSTDNILISMLVGTTMIGYYGNYQQVSTNVLMILSICFNSLTASVGNLLVSQDTKRSYLIFKTMQMICYLFSSILVVGLFFLYDDFISLWLGKEYCIEKSVQIAIILNAFFIITNKPISTFREAAGLFDKVKNIMCITAIMNLVLSVVLGSRYGLFGIIISTIISRISTYFWYEPILIYKSFFGISSREYFKNYLANLFYLGICVVICFAFINHINLDIFVGFWVKCVICIIVPIVIYFLIYKNKEEYIVLTKKIKEIMPIYSIWKS